MVLKMVLGAKNKSRDATQPVGVIRAAHIHTLINKFSSAT